MKLFDFIKAANFFPNYAPQVRNWKHKLRGVDGNKKPITFSEDDRKQIKQGAKKLLSDIKDW